LACPSNASAAVPKPRVVILTDISNEPDDQMSLVRFLTYADEFDVEGVIATTSCWKRNNPDFGAIRRVIGAYARVYDNLKLHSPHYPSPDLLRRVAKRGVNGYGMQAAAEQLDNEGVRHIVSVLQRDDSRPVWFCAWGGGNTLGGAVMKLRKKRPADAARLVAKIRGYEIALQDDAWAYIARHYPETPLISARLLWKGISRTTPRFNAWSESWGGNNEVFNAAWIKKHVQKGHGPLGEQYPSAVYLWEGDTPSFLYLVPNGLNFPEYPHYGGWGGRFDPNRKKNVRSGTGNNTVDGLLDKHRNYFLYSDTKDTWSDGSKEFRNEYCTVFRWREDFQWDFAARMDRCAKPFSQVNHAPHAAVNRDSTRRLLRITAGPGAEVALNAAGTIDPDKNRLTYRWWHYPEPGSYRGRVAIQDADTVQSLVRVPKDAAGKDFHIILTVTDDGMPPLKAYRRVVVAVQP
jgi:hypothetical protein